MGSERVGLLPRELPKGCKEEAALPRGRVRCLFPTSCSSHPSSPQARRLGPGWTFLPWQREVVEQAQLALEGSLCPGQTQLPGWLGSLRAACMVASHSAQGWGRGIGQKHAHEPQE